MSRASEDNRDSASLSLMRAASDGDVQSVRSLLAAGVDVNATNQGGQTALMLAALMGNNELVARLLEAGANPALRDRLGLTALEWSTRRGFSEVSQLLIKVSPTIDRAAPQATSVSASTNNEAKSRPPATRDVNTERLPSKEVLNISPAKSDEALDKGRAFPDQAKIEERSISSERSVEAPLVVTNSAPAEPTASTVQTESQRSAVGLGLPPTPIAEQPKTEAPSTPAPTPVETEWERLAVASAPPPPIAEQPKSEASSTSAPALVETESERLAVASAPPPTPIAEQPKTEAPSTPAPAPVETESERLAVAPAPPPPPIAEQPKTEAPSTPVPAPVETQSRRVDFRPQPAPTTEQPLDVDQILGAAAVQDPQSSATDLDSVTAYPSSGEQTVQSEDDEEETLTRPRITSPLPEITLPKAASGPPKATLVSEPAPTRPTHPPPATDRRSAFESSPLGLSTRAGSGESEDISNLKRCSKCDTVYRNTHLLYCTRDYAPLISVDATTKIIAEKPPIPSFKAPLSDSAASQSSTPVAVWLLIAFVLGASAFGAYRLTEYFSRTETPGPVAAKPAEAPVEVKKPFFSVGGALAGMELNVPEPEYPAEVQSAGVTGPITVRVRVNRIGKVISASTASGDQRLRTAAVRAARLATFAPDKLAQVSPRNRVVSGSITYEFAPKVGAATPPATAPVNGASPGSDTGTSSTTETGGSTAPTTTDPNSPIVDATLAGAAVNVPGAEYPSRAKRAGTGGTIIVTVRVNRAGRVVSWRSSTGDSQLRAAAIKAARKATFARDKLPGSGDIVGTITYNFTP